MFSTILYGVLFACAFIPKTYRPELVNPCLSIWGHKCESKLPPSLKCKGGPLDCFNEKCEEDEASALHSLSVEAEQHIRAKAGYAGECVGVCFMGINSNWQPTFRVTGRTWSGENVKKTIVLEVCHGPTDIRYGMCEA